MLTPADNDQSRQERRGLLLSVLFYMTAAFGISLTIRADIGVSSFNAMNVAIANAAGIMAGTVTIFFNSAFLMGYMYLTGFRLFKKYLVQLFFVLMFGTCINLFTYGFLGNLMIAGYWGRLALNLVGTLIGGLCVGMIVSYDKITFPIESVCGVLAERTRVTFTHWRYGVDVLSVAVSLAVSVLCGLPLYVREGTLISLVLFSFLVGGVTRLRAKAMAREASPEWGADR